MGDEAIQKAFSIVSELRAKGVSADLDHMGRGIKAQFKYADKIGAQFVAVIGSDEIIKGEIKIKKMSDGTESFVKFDQVYDYLMKA